MANLNPVSKAIGSARTRRCIGTVKPNDYSGTPTLGSLCEGRGGAEREDGHEQAQDSTDRHRANSGERMPTIRAR